LLEKTEKDWPVSSPAAHFQIRGKSVPPEAGIMTNGSPEVLLRHIRGQAGPDGAEKLADCDLLKCFASHGDEEAFAVLVRRHGPMVLRVCRRIMANAADADDVFQATFLVLAKKAGALPWQESVASWLQVAAFRLAQQARTAAARRRRHEALAEVRHATDAPLAEISNSETQSVLDEELARLPARYRGPVVLCYLEGRTQEEAARQNGWSLSTLKRRLRRAMELLHARLSRRGLNLSVVLAAALPPCETPESLVQATVQAGQLLLAGQIAGHSGRAVALAQAALKTMFLTRLKVVACVTLTAVLLALSIGLGTYRALATPKVPPQAARSEDVETPRLDKAKTRLGTTRLRLSGPAEAVAYSPDGSKVISCGGPGDCTVRLWDSVTGKQVWQRKLDQPMRAAAISRDGKWLAAGGDDRKVRLLEMTAGKELRLLAGHTDAIAAVAITPDGKTVISGSRDGSVRLWDSSSGKERQRLDTPGYHVRCLALSFDGKVLAAGCAERKIDPIKQQNNVRSNPIRLWDLPFGKERAWLSGHPAAVQALAFSRDGKALASGGMRGPLVLWDVASSRELRTVNPASWAQARHVARTGKPRFMTSRPGAGGLILKMPVMTTVPSVQALAFSPDDRTLACGCGDRTVYLVDPRTGKASCAVESLPLGSGFPVPPAEPYLPRRGIFSVAYAPKGQSLAVGSDAHAVRIWDLSPTSAVERSFGGHRGAVTSIAFSPDGRTLASAGRDEWVHFWDVRTGKQLRRSFQVPASLLPASPVLAFSPDGKSLAAATDSAALLWDVATGQKRWQIAVRGQQLLAFSADGKTLFLLQHQHIQRQIRQLNALTGRDVRPVRTGPPAVCKALSRDGQLLAWWGQDQPGRNQVAQIQQTSQGKEVSRFGKGEKRIWLLAFSSDGKMLAGVTGLPGRDGEQRIVLWSTATGRELSRSPVRIEGSIAALAFAPGGGLLASAGSDRTVWLWDLNTGKEVRRFRQHLRDLVRPTEVGSENGQGARRFREGHLAGVSCLAFAPDGRRLASGGDDGTVFLWNADSRAAFQ
jgi:RNA polymerase sigma factor (sigma-70 family)